MKCRYFYLVFFLLLMAAWKNGFSQNPASLLDSVILLDKTTPLEIDSILISGNRRTKENILARELPFQTGKTYAAGDLKERFETGARQLMNTSLFHTAVVSALSITDKKVVVSVHVQERWYVFPAPYFKPVDRNLNQWLVQEKGSIDRVNYGLKILHYNATGRNDKLRAWFINGYSKEITLSYDRLYINKSMKWGISGGLDAGKKHEVNYNTINDKQVFYKDNDSYLQSFLTFNAELTYRPYIKTRHHFGVAYSYQKLKDTVISLNPEYYSHTSNSIRYPVFYYTLEYFDVDYIPYPTSGYATRFTAAKRGFSPSVNSWEFSLNALGSWHLGHQFFFSTTVFGGLKLPFRQPYSNRQFLGYGYNYLQGYEYFVIDGSAGGFIKPTLSRLIAGFNFRLPQRKNAETLHVPVRIFAKTYANAGYVYNPLPGNNNLSNKMLYSAGFGIDIITLYDITFKLEYSFNQLGQNGLFLHHNSLF
jgi:outer membrane protein assembly factor BamA